MTAPTPPDETASLQRRLEREKQARKQAEALLTEKSGQLYEALRASKAAQKKLQLALWASQESFWEWYAHNDVFELRSFALTADSETVWQGKALELLSHVHEDDLTNLQFHWTLALHGGRDRVEVAFRFNLRKEFQWMRLRGRVLERDSNGTALRIVGTTRDITRERKAEQSFHLMASAFSSSREPMLVLSVDQIITECNNAFVTLLQLEDKQECIGKRLSELFPRAKDILKKLQSEPQVRFETYAETSSGLRIPLDVSIALFETGYQSASYLIATMRDISERKFSESRLRQLALHDDLTGLKNRNGLRDEVAGLIELNTQFVMLFIDLDGFKQINDAAGHDRGDECLKRVAQLLVECFSAESVIARWGGDEFVVVAPKLDQQEAKRVCGQLINRFEADQIEAQGAELRLSASIGIAQYPTHGDTVEGVLQNADAAMYQAKTSGKGRAHIYHHGLLESMKQQISMVADLRRAVDHGGLDFFIQGRFGVNGVLKGGELLCRWRSNILGMVEPAVFIPLAETHQLDATIGMLALKAACNYVKMMEAENQIPLSVNISANQVLSKEFVKDAVRICDDHRVPPRVIELELTESIFIRDQKSALRALSALREAGFRLVLDDFGAGFSSLSHLRSFQFEAVKLDSSLIKDIHTDQKALSLFQGVVAMLQSLKVEVTAEGVERPEYLPLLKEADIDYVQGFHFDKPMPYEQFLAKHHNF